MRRGENGGPTARRPRAALYTILAVALVFVGVLAAIVVVGPGRAIDWLLTYLIPTVVLLGVVVGVVGLLVREGGKVYDERDERHSTNFRESRRGEVRATPRPRAEANSVGRRGGWVVRETDDGFSDPVYWLLVCLFLLASVVMACFFWLVVREQWIHQRPPVAGRFDEGESLRMVFALLAAVAVPSGLLWRHYQKVDSYGSPLGLFFAAVFALCGALALVTVLPAIFAG